MLCGSILRVKVKEIHDSNVIYHTHVQVLEVSHTIIICDAIWSDVYLIWLFRHPPHVYLGLTIPSYNIDFTILLPPPVVALVVVPADNPPNPPNPPNPHGQRETSQ